MGGKFFTEVSIERQMAIDILTSAACCQNGGLFVLVQMLLPYRTKQKSKKANKRNLKMVVTPENYLTI